MRLLGRWNWSAGPCHDYEELLNNVYVGSRYRVLKEVRFGVISMVGVVWTSKAR